jgi:acetyl-CoA/propionyl-CoA carboxylase biotin carboxyl carrier protein
MFESVLIANRGEIARRVIRTLHRLGIRAVAVYSDADRDAPFVREADQALRIGPAPAAESYLSIDRILDAAERAGAEAIHPGYGFLSERPDFARACADAGLTFVGPPPEAMETMGDKLLAKEAARAAGVPVVPTYTLDEARRTADYPLLVKAAAGGGGRGMRVVESPAQLDDALAAARREAQAGFGDDRVFVERFLPRARHIEVQVIADAHGNVLHLGERECSLQRRHQKVLEEAPSPVVGERLRARMGEEAVALARAAGYRGAGTVELIANAADPQTHYFLEVNARLQVEHPVTELVTGLDLVELQLRVAAGEPLPLRQDDVALDGHAIEVRVNAEDPARGFLPATGRVLAYRRPAGARVDDGIEPGSRIGTDYDSLLGKLIVHATDRPAALAKLRRAIAGTAILGLPTNLAFLAGLVEHPAVAAGELDTGLLERVTIGCRVPADEVAAACALIDAARRAEHAGDDPFDRVDGWRLAGRRAPWRERLAVNGGEPLEVAVERTDDGYRVAVDGRMFRAGVERAPQDAVAGRHDVPVDAFVVSLDGRRREWIAAAEDGDEWLAHGGDAFRVRRPSRAAGAGAAADGVVVAPMPGGVLSVVADVGDAVAAGDPLLVLESMKLEMTMVAPFDGTLADLHVAAGDRVGLEQPLARVVPA